MQPKFYAKFTPMAPRWPLGRGVGGPWGSKFTSMIAEATRRNPMDPERRGLNYQRGAIKPFGAFWSLLTIWTNLNQNLVKFGSNVA